MENQPLKRDAPRPAVQQRSVDASRRMVEAGLRLLDERDIDQISIRDIVREARTSIGSFYHRYGTKEVFFSFLIDDMIQRREAVAIAMVATTPVAAIPEALAHGVIDNYLLHAGLMRSAIRCHVAGDHCWDRISQLGKRVVGAYLDRLAEALGRPVTGHEREQIGFVFLWLYGLMSYRVLRLNNVHGYTVSDKVFEAEAVRTFNQMMAQTVAAELRDASLSVVSRLARQ